ncbi:MAG: hypothetical protein L0Y36_04610, partial [Planctomycetales bacterium]|nr:hypothetical protein [Planctomycetales bacterium]
KIMIWIECPRSVGADYNFPQKQALAFQLYMTEKAKFEPENIILNPPTAAPGLVQDPQQIARSQGAGFVLLVHVDHCDVESLGVREYFSASLVTRAVLLDTDLGTAVWPKNPEGKMVELAIEMETGGRETLLSRLTAGVAHCTLRYFYPCEKLKFKHADERVSVQEAFEMGTF